LLSGFDQSRRVADGTGVFTVLAFGPMRRTRQPSTMTWRTSEAGAPPCGAACQSSDRISQRCTIRRPIPEPTLLAEIGQGSAPTAGVLIYA
jgi:hypothetical protein